MKKLFLLLFMVLTYMSIFAQNVNISGTVKSSLDDEPLIGVSILEKGTSNGTSTDIDGHFSISVKPGATLRFSYIGFTPKEYKVTGAVSDLEILLITDSQILDDVVVVGYGTQKKGVVTAAISQVSEETWLKQLQPTFRMH